MRRAVNPDALEPMYATIGDDVPRGASWTFEPKYDGMRVLAFVSPRRIRLVTRNGKDKAAQFPEVVETLRALAAKRRGPLVLDGEVVALERNKPGHFQSLQSRFHLTTAPEIARLATASPAAYVVFDLLVEGTAVLLHEPWHVRRRRLERVLRGVEGRVRLGATSPNGARMIQRARRARWEGIVAKRTDAPYVPGARSRDWLKLKLQHRAEFVVGGFTEPRRTRPHLGAILLGYFDAEGRLHYVGHTGGGFSAATLREMRGRLDALERSTSPFVEAPRTNERAHWVKPEVVVEVKFAEWTADGRLRQPIFLGVRDDKDAADVHLERESVQRLARSSAVRREATPSRRPGGAVRLRPTPAAARAVSRRAAAKTRTVSPKKGRRPASDTGAIDVEHQLEELERTSKDGTLALDRRSRLRVSSLDKVFFPDAGITKGDVMRYYAAVSPALLPLLADRPLILKRYPNGINGPSFFQQNAGAHPAAGARVAQVETEDGESASRLIGGDLLTLLYTVQLGTIAVHPWQSRLPRPDSPDYSTIDLDPAKGVAFARVVELAAYIHEDLTALGLHAALKTSGSRGLHIVLPLPARTTYTRSAALADTIARHVVAAHPKLATLERRLDRRPAGTIYVDAQQNARGKSVASAYSVRERPGAPVSAPLRWSELTPSLRLSDFTIATMPDRIAQAGDIWGDAMKQRNAARLITRIVGDA